MASSRVISSTYAIGCVRGFPNFMCLREDAKANAYSNLFCLCLRDLTEYQAAPLRGFPRALGIMKNQGMFEVPSRWIALVQNSGGSVKFGFAVFKFPSMLSRRVIRRSMTTTDIAIKVGLLVLWCKIGYLKLRTLIILIFHRSR
jgi:hypothetical protein